MLLLLLLWQDSWSGGLLGGGAGGRTAGVRVAPLTEAAEGVVVSMMEVGG